MARTQSIGVNLRSCLSKSEFILVWSTLIQFKMCIHINDLPIELLNQIFIYLPTQKLFQIEVVCKNWQISVRESLSRKVKTIEVHLVEEEFKIHEEDSSTICIPETISDDNLVILKNILSRCNNIKELVFEYTIPDGNSAELAKLLPKVERFRVYFMDHKRLEYDHIDKEQWHQFAKIIAPQLKYCSIDVNVNDYAYRYHMTQSLVNYFKDIQEFDYHTKYKGEDIEVFWYLNSCQNLKKLKWNDDNKYSSHEIDPSDYHMIGVLQKIQYLEIDFLIFKQLKNTMDNLVELTISRPYNLYYDHFYKSNFDQFSNISMDQIVFPSLKKLIIHDSQLYYFKMISKLKFPNLEHIEYSCLLEYHWYDNYKLTKIPSFDQTKFFKQIKNVKMFNCHGFTPNNDIVLLENLTQLKFDLINFNNEELNQFFDGLAKLKNLQKINLEYKDLEKLNVNVNVNALDKIIGLRQTKPNSSIEFEIKFNYDNKQIFDDYMKTLEQFSNWMVEVEKSEESLRMKVTEKSMYNESLKCIQTLQYYFGSKDEDVNQSLMLLRTKLNQNQFKNIKKL